jgi:hypothetical protein
MINYREGSQRKTKKGKGHLWVKTLRRPGPCFQESSPRGVAQNLFTSLAMNYDNSWEFTGDSVFRGFTRGWSPSHYLPGIQPTSRFPEGEQGFSLCHIVHPDNWGTGSLFHQVRWWESSPSKFTCTSHRPTFPSGLCKDNRQRHTPNFFLHNHPSRVS